jgi:Arc/MetJ-type ribon-helix-helix transcriptional regulator
MSELQSYQRRAFAEAVTPYGAAGAGGPHKKLSISLPTDLVELVRGAAAERGVSVSAMIGAAIRRTLEEAEQARLDAAIEAQNEENLQWAEAYLPIAAKLWSEIEW